MTTCIPIQDPYPIPEIGTALIQKPSRSSKVGVGVVTKKDNAVVVSSLKPGNLLQGTSVQKDTEIFAINGQAVNSAKQATSIMKSSIQLEFTTILDTSRIPRFCYVEVSPTSKICPGASFESCCDGTMVMISHVFLDDLTKTRLRVGDIVLAVNGVPVWKPQDAHRILLHAARASQAVVLYCVNMDTLLDHIVLHHAERHRRRATTKIVKTEPGVYEVTEDACWLTAKVNHQTQLLQDTTPMHFRLKIDSLHTPTTKSMGLSKRRNYVLGCEPTLRSMNDLLQKQLDQLKAKIVEEAWRYSMNQTTTGSNNDTSTGSCPVIKATSAPISIGATCYTNLPLATASPVSHVVQMDVH